MVGKSGPLSNVRVLEFAGIGPVPFCGMLMSDLGADILRIDRPGAEFGVQDVMGRGKSAVVLDLKESRDVDFALELSAKADVLIEGYRPGVMEKFGLSPGIVMKTNPRLIYARMTGWGQTGPLAQVAGHDINYIALAGALACMGTPSMPPAPPLNLVGDFGGGSLYLAVGILAALIERQRSGAGQVIDAAMIDGTASMMAILSVLNAREQSSIRRGENLLDGSAHFYRTYECKDGRYVSIGAIEPAFYALLWKGLGSAAPPIIPSQKRHDWAAGTETLARIFKSKTRDEWCAIFEGTDACFAPVMEYDEAHRHPHMSARQVYVESFGVAQPSPAPRFSRTPGAIQGPPPGAALNREDALHHWKDSAQ